MKKTTVLFTSLLMATALYSTNFYVDASVAVGGDGLSWETAKKTLPEALSLAKTNNATSQNDNIYVKEGTYTTVPLDLTDGDCTGISLFGGYALANTGTGTYLRNVSAHPTIIDAQKNANAVKISQRVLVDGFFIQNGLESSYTMNAVSAGLAINHPDAVVSNCIIRNNVRTTGNFKGMAGGVFIKQGTVQYCQIYQNKTTHANSLGGAVQMTGGTLIGNKIFNNNAGTVGMVGGVIVGKVSSTNIYIALDYNVIIANNIIYNNGYQGIKVSLIDDSKTVTLTNNTIVNNGVPCLFNGAGIGVLTARNNIFQNNGGTETLAGNYTYNAIQASSVTGEGNIMVSNTNTELAFTEPFAYSGVPSTNADSAALALADWSITGSSVAINGGTNTAAVGTVDAAGNARIQQTNVDLGALESSFVRNIKPSAPTGLASSDLLSTSFTLTWDAATDADGTIVLYEILIDGNGYATTSNLSYDIINLSLGSSYSITVRAKDNADGWSDASTAIIVNTPAGIESNHAPISFRVVKGGIQFNSYAQVAIYHLNGQKVFSGEVASKKIDLEKGIYLVKSNTEIKKVIIL